jgi:hypothetical protein
MTQKTMANNLHLPPADEARFMEAFFEYRKIKRQLIIPASGISLSDHIRLRMRLSTLCAEYGFEPYAREMDL